MKYDGYVFDPETKTHVIPGDPRRVISPKIIGYTREGDYALDDGSIIQRTAGIELMCQKDKDRLNGL